MAISQADFWKLLVKSKLLTEEQLRPTMAQFAASPKKEESAKSLAEWLLRQKLLSKYQATILLSGRAGPFVFGDYQIHDRIEEGRLRKLYRAVHSPTKHPVLIRFLTGSVTESQPLWDDMQSWLPVTEDSHLSRCYEAIESGKLKFLVIEDLRGESLADLLARSPRLPFGDACRLMRLASLGLARLHENGKVHGDFRPHQCWIEANGNLKILVDPDAGTRMFELSKAERIPDGPIRSEYAAPEFTFPGRIPDALSDIYALGCTLYELISGSVPFPGGTPFEKLQRHATEAIRPLDEFGVPPALMQAIAYAMAKNPAVRTQQARLVADQLSKFVSPEHLAPRPAPPVPTAAAYETWLRPNTAATPGSSSVTSHPARPMTAAELMSMPTPVQTPIPVAAQTTQPTVAPMTFEPPPAVATVPLADAPIELFPTEKPRPSVIEQRRRARARKRSNLINLSIALVVLALAVGTGLWLLSDPSLLPEGLRPGSKVVNADTKKETLPAVPPPVAGTDDSQSDSSPSSPETAVAAAAAPVIIPDDGQSLWLAPTEGDAISLEYVPPRAQMFMVARPAEFLSHPEGARVIKGLGPEFEAVQTMVEGRIGLELRAIEQLIVAFHSNGGEAPKTSLIARTKDDIDSASVLAKWGGPASVAENAGLFQQADQAYYLPPDNKRVVVVGPASELTEAAKNGWKPPLLRRELAQLVRASDRERLITWIFAPAFLLHDSRALFSGNLDKALSVAEWLLDDDILAAMVSVHLDDNLFVEMRLESDFSLDRFRLASRVRERLAQVPEQTELYIANLNPHPYWRLVANRYPQMVRFLHQQSRVGVDGDHAVVNAVLPGIAAHNLAFGGEMLLASAPGEALASNTSTPAVTSPSTIDEVLKAKISISFSQESLEFAMQNVVTEVTSSYAGLPFEFKIRILGPDLEKDGITRNQQVRDFNQQNTTVAEVLTAMVRKANPGTSMKEPHELDQKLVWVVGPDPDKPSERIVLITTRGGAEQRKLTLPAVFHPK